MDISSGLSAVTSAIGIAKAVKDASGDLDKAHLRLQMAEIIGSLADTKIALVEAKEAQHALEQELQRLRKAEQDFDNLVIGEGDYKYFANDSGMAVGFPICPKCETDDRKICQLKQKGYAEQAECPSCSKTYEPVTEYLDPSKSQYRTRAEETEAKHAAAMARNSDVSYF